MEYQSLPKERNWDFVSSSVFRTTAACVDFTQHRNKGEKKQGREYAITTLFILLSIYFRVEPEYEKASKMTVAPSQYNSAWG